MWNFIVYLGESAICLAALFILYKATMSYETLHRLNRVVLLGMVVLAAVLPLCEIKIIEEVELLPLADVEGDVAMMSVVEDTAFDYVAWLKSLAVALFCLGAAFMVVRLVVSQLSVWRMTRSGARRELDEGVVLTVVEKLATPFSWFRNVVVAKSDAEQNLDLILEHELAHVRLHHSWDVLAVDIALCVWWFNPALWLLRRELQSLHEYQADDAVLRKGVDAKTYQMLLIKRAVGSRLHSVANCLNHSNLKNRITMMCKKTSSRWSAAKLLLILPLVAASLAATATTVYVPKEQNKGNENFVETQIATADEEQPYIKVQQMPTFQGGDLNAYRNWMQSQLQYPKEAKGIKGRVIFSFVVEKDGSVSNFDALQAPDKILVEEVERVFKLTPKWEPGKQNGKEVRVKFTVPIVFTGDDVAVYNRVFSQGTPLSEMSKDAESAVGEVSGRVIDAKTKKPIPDVILLVNGAGVGTHSDASGCYSLKKLPEGKYTFVASCVGYKSVKKDFEISSKKSVEVNFELEEQAVAVDEIVVDKNKTAAQSLSNVEKALFEKDYTIVLIDGKEGKIDDIDVDDIESFTVLKGEQATKIYGEKGKNGVMLFTTKKAAQANKQQPAQEEAFIKVESMPTFQGGDLNGYRNWVQSQLQYPKEAKEKGISGRVIFSFVVEKDGSVTSFKGLQAPDKILVDEVERVFKLTPKWEPGKQNGKAVRVKYTVPIYFMLEDADTATTVQLEVGSKAKAHFDIGLSLIKQADALQEKIDLKAYGSTEFRSLQKEITDKYLDAVPELEKAYELAPNYKPIVETLKLLTFRLRDENGMMAKYEKYKKAFDLMN
ncbi:MAG: TonB family protein [Alistipes sp.]|nr:TonB family protein [Alistipes sp.]